MIEARNHTKVRALLYLNDRFLEATEENIWHGGSHTWRAPATIARDTGVNEASLRILLKRWRSASWGYVEALHFNALQMADKRPHWLYRINSRGQAYLARLHRWYKAEAEVKAELEAYYNEIGYDLSLDLFNQGKLEPRCIGWHIKPSKMITIIRYPFERKSDAHFAVWYMHGFEVGNIEEAVFVARSVFHIKPTKECLTQAEGWQDSFVKEALEELASSAGFATTE